MILDYSVGNIFSIKKAFEKILGSKVSVKSRVEVQPIDVLVLPGVGNFRSASKEIDVQREVLNKLIERGVKIFGVCLGMQLLGERSEEGGGLGLGLIKGNSFKLPQTVKIPHIGWNSIKIVKNDPLFEEIENGSYFYFVHSYYLKPMDKEVVLAETSYGVNFPSIVKTDIAVGMQFHPEKSGKKGIKLIKNFLKLVKK